VLAKLVWGPVLIILLVGTGIYLILILRGIQFRKLFHILAIIAGKYDNPGEGGKISHFQAPGTFQMWLID
jgi:AGCS family alanine or glycine:cation symporter